MHVSTLLSFCMILYFSFFSFVVQDHVMHLVWMFCVWSCKLWSLPGIWETVVFMFLLQPQASLLNPWIWMVGRPCGFFLLWRNERRQTASGFIRIFGWNHWVVHFLRGSITLLVGLQLEHVAQMLVTLRWKTSLANHPSLEGDVQPKRMAQRSANKFFEHSFL